ncbi:MAG: M61 family metallopeptidase [Saprospiraceae bacterium]|nr:M61 family metallopeptidase [Saprospiraceae bacterium]MCB9317944.1 M61 family metallopeptidase [Lewinellaceae bacterium]
MKQLIYSLMLFGALQLSAQTPVEYVISFPNAVHHEAEVQVTYRDVPAGPLEIRMSRSSPGRYAVHEFAKNCYATRAVDGDGHPLEVTHPNPYQWNVLGHHGTVVFSYTLFGDRGDGTYAQIDETHAHLNMPATFAFARGMDDRPIRVTFNLREDLRWKVATQLKPESATTYIAPNLQYFMDSPTEISDFQIRTFTETSNGKSYQFRLVLHAPNEAEVIDEFKAAATKIVAREKAVYQELPGYDYGTYTFICCYMPQASGDGMEHRNSTFISGNIVLDSSGLERAYGTVAHEFFHCWNVERIRPKSLEPFDFEQANMSGELWFAEGFTSYYTDLTLCRAGLITKNDYISGISGGLNAVINSPARRLRTPVEMSQFAPFADAASSIDPVNFGNTFISYYTYGKVLGLALDLSLRNQDRDLSLDGFMARMWGRFGKPEIPYTVAGIESTLAEYAGEAFASNFFNQYIYHSELPDYQALLNTVGISLTLAHPGQGYWGATLEQVDHQVLISRYASFGTPAYQAGLDAGDQILTIDGQQISSVQEAETIIRNHQPGDVIQVQIERFGTASTKTVKLMENPQLQTGMIMDALTTEADRVRQNSWLDGK